MSYKLIIEGFDDPILIAEGQTTSLGIFNKNLFSRVVSSLLKGTGEGLENFAFYKDDSEAKFLKETISIVNPFDLPFKNATLLKSLFQRMDEAVKYHDDILIKVNELQLLLNQVLLDSYSSAHCEYDFGVEFDVKKYLKAFGYSSYIDEASSLLENLISFLNFIADVAPQSLIFFVNLGSFLDEKGYVSFCEAVFSLKLTSFIVNSGEVLVAADNHKNYTVDQHFILS